MAHYSSTRLCQYDALPSTRLLSKFQTGTHLALTMRRAAHSVGAMKTSRRVEQTDSPVIVKTKQLMAGATDVISLAQGIVHWAPPASALSAAAEALTTPGVSSYGPCDGLPALIAELEAKVAQENDLYEHRIMVTAGANQAFVNVVLTLLDASDRVVLFVPYYFNHLMAIQMTGGANSVVLGRCDPRTFHPDLDWLEEQLQQPKPPKMVVLVNPCNPTGILLTDAELQRASDICQAAGTWLVMDNTYEHMVYEGRRHRCIAGNHVVHIFSFSKAFGMMGWRTGYIAYQDTDGMLTRQIQKVQDTIPICPPQLSMHVALAASREGRPWVEQQLQSLLGNREVLLDALSPLGRRNDGIAGGEGAIYLWARLPPGCEDDEAVVEWLIKRHGVCVIPGTACGSPGHIRVAFGNLRPDLCQAAAAKLKAGLTQLVEEGFGGTVQHAENEEFPSTSKRG